MAPRTATGGEHEGCGLLVSAVVFGPSHRPVACCRLGMTLVVLLLRCGLVGTCVERRGRAARRDAARGVGQRGCRNERARKLGCVAQFTRSHRTDRQIGHAIATSGCCLVANTLWQGARAVRCERSLTVGRLGRKGSPQLCPSVTHGLVRHDSSCGC